MKALFSGLTEAAAVAYYKKTSIAYKNANQAAMHAGVEKKTREQFQSLAQATTFAGMLKNIDNFDFSKEKLPVRLAVKAVCTIGSFFSNEANAGYYIIRLRDDIIRYANQNGYKLESKEDNTQSFKPQ